MRLEGAQPDQVVLHNWELTPRSVEMLVYRPRLPHLPLRLSPHFRLLEHPVRGTRSFAVALPTCRSSPEVWTELSSHLASLLRKTTRTTTKRRKGGERVRQVSSAGRR